MEDQKTQNQEEKEDKKVIEIKTPRDAVEFLYYQAKLSTNGIQFDAAILDCANFALNSLHFMENEISKLKSELESIKNSTPETDLIKNENTNIE